MNNASAQILDDVYHSMTETDIVFSTDLRKALIKRVQFGTAPVESAKFFGSEEYIVTTADELGVKLWKIWDRRMEFYLGPKSGPISETCFDSDLKQIIGTGMDSCLYVWDVGSGKTTWMRETDFGLLCCDISPDNQTIVTGSDFNHNITIWDLRTGSPVTMFSSYFTGSITSVDFSPDAYRFAAVSLDDPVTVVDLRVNKPTLTLHDDSVLVSDLSWSDDGRKLLTSAMDSHVYVYDVATGEYRNNPERLSPHIVRPACFTCCDFSTVESRFYACGSTDGYLSIWDLDRNDVLFDLLSHADASVKDCAFSPNGKYLITACSDGTGRIWSLEDLKSTKRYREKMDDQPTVKKCRLCGVRFRGNGTEVTACESEDCCSYCRLKDSWILKRAVATVGKRQV